ncbi:hypothetical protein AR687_08780 [Flavobacteriaceae bacterium CRH]|nr:hypothetical protein AR687_08780 [Flavobacteriaceae bacterium CRH]
MGATERVKEFIDYKGITRYKFCQMLGFSNKFLDNTSNIGTDKASKILHHFPDLSAEWLLSGKGNMLKLDILNETPAVYNKTKNEDLEDNVNYKQLAETQKETIENLKNKIVYLEAQLAAYNQNKN